VRTRKRRRLFGPRNADWVLRGGGGGVFGLWNLLTFSMWASGEFKEGKGKRREDNGRLRRGSLGCAGFCFCFCGAFFAGAGVCFAMIYTHVVEGSPG
jgi:hypothetical protein